MIRIAVSTIALAAGIGVAFAQAPGAQSPARDDAARGQGAGQGTSQRSPVQPEDQPATRSGQPGAPQTGGAQGQQGAAGQGTTERSPDKPQDRPADRSGEPGAGGNVTLTTEQRTEIRQQVLQGSHAPRVDTVSFSINVGTAVPSTVRVVEVPESLVRIRPAWRGHFYFVVKDQIIIVDKDHKIVAVVAV